MENNKVHGIDVAVQDRPSSYKDKSSSTHITMDFGSVVPGRFQRVYPDTEFGVGDSERVILTSLVAPCFGQLSLRSYSYFVPFSDLTRNFSALMAQQSVNRGSSSSASFVPQTLPYILMRDLSAFVLTGAQMTVYSYDTNSNQATLYALPANQLVSDDPPDLPSVMQVALQVLGLTSASYNKYGLSNAYHINIGNLLGWNSGSGVNTIPLGNLYASTFFDARVNHPNDTVPNMDPVPLEDGYDYVVPITKTVSGTTYNYILAFRLSSFGRRLRKILIGLGWQFSLTSTKKFSVMRLVAYYLAYFNLFGLQRYSNWEQTYAYKVMQVSDLVASKVYSPFQSGGTNADQIVFVDFIMNELGCCFYTEEMDFVSSHQRSTAVSPDASGVLSNIIDIPSANINFVNSTLEPSSTGNNGHSYINVTNHGQLDSKLLMRLYRQANVNTVAGRRIAELCRAQGLGPDMEKVKCNFIGSWELELDIYDLPSQSDTYQKVSGTGKQLGEFGAYGKSVGKHDKIHFKANEDGYFINLIVVVPKGGYCQTVDPDACRVDKYGQYNPEFDSLGMQLNTKDEVILGNIDWQQTGYENASGTTDGTLTDSFGIAPRYFEKKFGRNVINGDFSLHSTKNSYSQWNLEKLMSVNDHKLHNVQVDPNGNTTAIVRRLNTPASLPIAGDVWRYSTRYEWLARFNRIFYNSFSTFSDMENIADSVRTAMYEYFSLRDDNFILHLRYDFAVYDKMLPVQKSFETEDEELKSNSRMSKA